MGTILKNLATGIVENEREKKLIVEFETLHYKAVQTEKIPDADPVTGDLTLKFSLDKTSEKVHDYYTNRFEYNENIDWSIHTEQSTTVYVRDGIIEEEEVSTTKPT